MTIESTIGCANFPVMCNIDLDVQYVFRKGNRFQIGVLTKQIGDFFFFFTLCVKMRVINDCECGHIGCCPISYSNERREGGG